MADRSTPRRQQRQIEMMISEGSDDDDKEKRCASVTYAAGVGSQLLKLTNNTGWTSLLSRTTTSVARTDW